MVYLTFVMRIKALISLIIRAPAINKFTYELRMSILLYLLYVISVASWAVVQAQGRLHILAYSS